MEALIFPRPKLVNMKTFYWLLSALFVIPLNAHSLLDYPGTEDPISLSKQIIADSPNPWSSDTRNGVLATYGPLSKLGTNDDKYVLLESPGLAFDYFQGGHVGMGEYISKGLLLEILNQALNNPESVTSKLAKATINKGLSEYKTAYVIAEKYKGSDEMTLEESIRFLDNRYGYSKLDYAQQLLNSKVDRNSTAFDEKNKKKITQKIKEIEKKYPDQIAWVEALPLIEEWYRLLEEGQVGLAAYAPYKEFKKSMDQLNQARINERISFRSTIKITYPDRSTVWTQPGPVDIKWESSNIDSKNPIRFFLVKDDMVVQDLGTFKNSEYRDGIDLRRGLPPGDNYRVMGIEQQPVNKYHVAKFATAFFTIEKAPRKGESRIASVPVKKAEIKSSQPPTTAVVEAKPARSMFAGRTISYVKELEVDSEDIQIILWDHGRQDGDIVSIYLNGEEVIKKHHLTYREVLFEVKLDGSEKNDLFLYAHNLGKFPPNTVSIKIKDNSTTEEIVLNSDLKSCESVLINVTQ